MNKNSYSTIGHRDLLLCNPLSSAKFDKIIELLKLTPKQTAVDYGAGKAEFLIRLIARYGVSATAVELDDVYASDAAKAAEGRIPSQKLDIVICDAKEHAAQSSRPKYDLSICIGSTHAFGGFSQTLDALIGSSKSRGYVLAADLYWKVRPDPDFLGFLEMQEQDLGTYESCIAQAEQKGLVPLWASAASQEDFDEYEWSCQMARENYIFEHPEEIDVQTIAERNRSWRNAYVKWGRDAFGFGLFLFRKSS